MRLMWGTARRVAAAAAVGALTTGCSTPGAAADATARLGTRTLGTAMFAEGPMRRADECLVIIASDADIGPDDFDDRQTGGRGNGERDSVSVDKAGAPALVKRIDGVSSSAMGPPVAMADSPKSELIVVAEVHKPVEVSTSLDALAASGVIRCLDLSDPQNPVLTQHSLPEGGHVIALDVHPKGDWVAVAATAPGGGWRLIILRIERGDIVDEADPTQLTLDWQPTSVAWHPTEPWLGVTFGDDQRIALATYVPGEKPSLSMSAPRSTDFHPGMGKFRVSRAGGEQGDEKKAVEFVFVQSEWSPEKKGRWTEAGRPHSSLLTAVGVGAGPALGEARMFLVDPGAEGLAVSTDGHVVAVTSIAHSHEKLTAGTDRHGMLSLFYWFREGEADAEIRRVRQILGGMPQGVAIDQLPPGQGGEQGYDLYVPEFRRPGVLNNSGSGVTVWRFPGGAAAALEELAPLAGPRRRPHLALAVRWNPADRLPSGAGAPAR